VGRGGNMLLNVPPNRAGLISSVDSAALMSFKKIREEAFANNILKGANILRTKEFIEIHLANEVSLNTLVLKEKINLGQRVVRFEITGGNDINKFDPIVAGTTIGHKRILQFPTQKLKYLRIKFNQYKAIPILGDIEGYLAP
jgi:alpha-L-fucosidase